MKDIRNIIILVLIGVILYLTQCNRPDETPQQIVIKDSLIYVPPTHDTIPLPYGVRYDSIIYKDSLIWKDSIVYTETVWIDTANLILDYFFKRAYNDTITLDSLGWILVNDTIYNNRILSRKVIRNIDFTIKPLVVRSNRFYWGFSILGNTQQFNAITGDILFVQPKNAYSLGVGTDGSNWVFKGSIYFKF